MRLHLAAFAAFLISLVAAPAEAATRNFTVTSFDRIRVDGPYRVKLTTGVAPFASASGPAGALDSLSLEVEGRTLIVRRKTARVGAAALAPVSISAGTHELAAAWLNGSGGLAIDSVKGQAFQLSVTGSGAAEVGKLSVDRLRVSVTGSAAAALGGTAQTGTYSMSGPASLRGAGLSTKSAVISAEGPATIHLTVTDSVKVDAKGLAVVKLSGSPACTVRPTSSAEVHGCR
jgi:hypothetical protein